MPSAPPIPRFGNGIRSESATYLPVKRSALGAEAARLSIMEPAFVDYDCYTTLNDWDYRVL